MASRRFLDAQGTEWMVLEVKPTRTERRGAKDRRKKDAGPPPGQPERRKGGDRRRGLGDTGPRVKINSELAHGWLAFEGAGERRRLTPVPDGWLEMPEWQLVGLLETATVVSVRRGRLIE